VRASNGCLEGKSFVGFKVQGRSRLKMVGRHGAELKRRGSGSACRHLRSRAQHSWVWKLSVGRCFMLIHVDRPLNVHGRSALAVASPAISVARLVIDESRLVVGQYSVEGPRP
jgi:hypothetical protein